MRSVTSGTGPDPLCFRAKDRMELSQALDEVLQHERLHCGAVIDELGQVLVRAGDFESYPAPDLVASLLGTPGAAHATYLGLDGQPLPQIWGEGASFAFVDRPISGIAFVLFGVATPPRLAFLRPRSGEHEANNLLESSKRVGRRLREAWAR